MNIGIDVQVVAEGNRSGLYTHLRNVFDGLKDLSGAAAWAFAECTWPRSFDGEKRRDLRAALPSARVHLSRQPKILYRVRSYLSPTNRVDVLLHNLHGRLQPSSRAANVYLVPDLIPMAIDYGPAMQDHYLPYYRAALQHADAIIVSSEHTRQDFILRIGGDPDRIVVAPLAAGHEFRPAPSRRHLDGVLTPFGLATTPYVLMVATIEKRKDHATLIRAFAALIERCPSLPHKLVLVGSKWIGHEQVFDLIRAQGLTERVVYLGFVDSLPSLYAGADAFVFPSLYEGFGLPPLEAMASGVPVIAANATSLPEVVQNAGILFEPGNHEALSTALQRVLMDEPLRHALRRQGLSRAAEFSWDRTARRYLDTFTVARDRFLRKSRHNGSSLLP